MRKNCLNSFPRQKGPNVAKWPFGPIEIYCCISMAVLVSVVDRLDLQKLQKLISFYK